MTEDYILSRAREYEEFILEEELFNEPTKHGGVIIPHREYRKQRALAVKRTRGFGNRKSAAKKARFNEHLIAQGMKERKK